MYIIIFNINKYFFEGIKICGFSELFIKILLVQKTKNLFIKLTEIKPLNLQGTVMINLTDPTSKPTETAMFYDHVLCPVLFFQSIR
jgi:hypothetical protein